MEPSILKSTKKLLGVSPDDTSFDLDIITYINSAFSTLHDLGVGPEDGFAIEDETVEWDSYGVADKVKLSKVKIVVQLHARLLFDPPTSSYLLEAIQEQITEQQWRLSTNREATAWADPSPPDPRVLEEVFDVEGGGASG